MSNELKSLSGLFENRLFRIPDYQRGYAWQHAQLADFWEDLVNLHEDRFHYTGLLSLKAIPKKSTKNLNEDAWLAEMGFTAFHVVDGQQRLTSFSILINELVSFVEGLPDNLGKAEDTVFIGFESLKDIRIKYIMRKRPPQNLITSYLFGYEIDNPSADYLKYKVFDEPYGGTVEESYYTRNLKYAKLFFSQSLNQLFDDEGMLGIERLYKKLTQRLMFNLHEIEDDYDVFVAFETMNNRGKKLTNLELLKNRLIYLTTLFSDKQIDNTDKNQLRKNINDAWKEIYYQLGRNQHNPLDDDEFLRAHWITYFQYSRKKGDDYIRFLLDKFSAKNIFEKKSMIGLAERLEGKSLEDAPSDYDDFDSIIQEPEIVITGKLLPKDISNYINSLKVMAEFWYYSFFPEDNPSLSNDEKAWIAKLNRIGIGYFRPLVAVTLANSARTSVQERMALFTAIERFIFVEFRMGASNSNYKSSDYHTKTREFASSKKNISEITDDLLKTTNLDKQTAVASFIARMDQRFATGEGFYVWKDLRYFLYEYEYDKSIQYNLEKLDWKMFAKVEKDKLTIEHILPQSPSKWYWQNQFRQYSSEEIKTLSASLGNLLPLAQSINSGLQNDGFPEKKSSLPNKRRGYENGSHSEIEVAQNNDWTANHILERGLKLLEYMESRWDISFGGDEQKISVLGIGFVNELREDIPEIPKTENECSSFKLPRKLVDTNLNVNEASVGGSKKGTTEITVVAYNVATHVYNGTMSRTAGRDEIVNLTGMNPGTANDCISNFLCMMEGKKYIRTLTEAMTRYFLENIRKDYGSDYLGRALESVEKHRVYYAGLGYGKLAYVERILAEYC